LGGQIRESDRKLITGTIGERKVCFSSSRIGNTCSLGTILDIMHIENNICDCIVGTFLEMDGKSKDGPKARLNLEDLKNRKDR
jgi:hypothetical protein